MNSKQLAVLLLGVLITAPTALFGQERPVREMQQLERKYNALKEREQVLRQELERNRGNDQQPGLLREREQLEAARAKLEAQWNARVKEFLRKKGQSNDRAPQRVSAERVQRERDAARERLEHMQRAHEHLMAAGMTEIAQQVAERAEGLQQRLERAAREMEGRERPARRRPVAEGDFQAEIIGAIRELNSAVRQLRRALEELREDVEEIEEAIEEGDDDDDEGEDDDEDDEDEDEDDGRL